MHKNWQETKTTNTVFDQPSVHTTTKHLSCWWWWSVFERCRISRWKGDLALLCGGGGAQVWRQQASGWALCASACAALLAVPACLLSTLTSCTTQQPPTTMERRCGAQRDVPAHQQQLHHSKHKSCGLFASTNLQKSAEANERKEQ